LREVAALLEVHAIDRGDLVVRDAEGLAAHDGLDDAQLVRGADRPRVGLDRAERRAAGRQGKQRCGGEPHASITKSKRPSPATLRMASASRNSGSRRLPASPGK